MKYNSSDYYTPNEAKKLIKKSNKNHGKTLGTHNAIWTPEENEILLQNLSKTYSQLQLLLPKHKHTNIVYRKKAYYII